MKYNNKNIKRYISILMMLMMVMNLEILAQSSKGFEQKDDIRFFDSNPDYDYEYAEKIDVSYTYYKEFDFKEDDTVVFETKKSNNCSDADTVLHLFKKNNSKSAFSWMDDNGGDGKYSKLSVKIPCGGTYYLMVRENGGDSKHCDIYKDGNCIEEDALISGKVIKINNKRKSGVLNYFTANSSVDTVLWVMDSNKKIRWFNDNVEQHGEYNWGLESRIQKKIDNIKYVIVGTNDNNSVGTTDLYMKCEQGYSSPTNFPKLDPYNSIKSGDKSYYYNCISWSGGITDTWINPTFDTYGGRLWPWYNQDNNVAFDNYYGNKPLRYVGAMTYELTNDANEAVVDVWKKGDEYTHASVKKPSNNMPHGYSWESKLGGNQRIFHPRYDLEGDVYGSVVRHYKLKASGYTSIAEYNMDNSISFRESTDKGLTTTQQVKINSQLINKLGNKNMEVFKNDYIEFMTLYNTWIEAINRSDNLSIINDYNNFTKIIEYDRLMKYLNDLGKDGWVYIVKNYDDKQDVFSQMLVEKFIVAYDKTTIQIADEIRRENNRISAKSINHDVYIAPTYRTNLICFINRILDMINMESE